MNVLIVEGGAMRSVFSAGLLDGFLQYQFNPFERFIGVSAGASNLSSFLSGHAQQSFQMYLKLAQHPSFISFLRFFKGGHLLDLELLHAEISALGLDLYDLTKKQQTFEVVTTDVCTGLPLFLQPTSNDLVKILIASMALPMIYRHFPVINGITMADGGMASAIPVQAAITQGAKKIVVVRARSQHYKKKDTLGHRYIRWHLKDYPALVQAMKARTKKHAETIALIQSPPQGVQVIDVCPPNDFRLGRFGRNPQQIHYGYGLGFNMAKDVIQQWHSL